MFIFHSVLLNVPCLLCITSMFHRVADVRFLLQNFPHRVPNMPHPTCDPKIGLNIKLTLFSNLYFRKVYVNLEKHFIR
jgi:hypothetical protein